MKVRGMHGTNVLFILIDSGSTHNFLDQRIAERLGCKMQDVGARRVKVADGNKLKVRAKVDSFQWTFQNETFKEDMMVIPLGGVTWFSEFNGWRHSDPSHGTLRS